MGELVNHFLPGLCRVQGQAVTRLGLSLMSLTQSPSRNSSRAIPWKCVQRHRGQLEQRHFRGIKTKAAAVGCPAELCSTLSLTSTKGNTFPSISAAGMSGECSDTMGWPQKPSQSPGGSRTLWLTLLTSHTGLEAPSPCPPSAGEVREWGADPGIEFLWGCHVWAEAENSLLFPLVLPSRQQQGWQEQLEFREETPL